MLLGLVERAVGAQLGLDFVVAGQRLACRRRPGCARGLALGEREIVDAVLGHDARRRRGDARSHAVMPRCPAAHARRMIAQRSAWPSRRIAALSACAAHLHILGICGTFMGGIAAIAQQAGLPRHRLRRQRLSADERPARRARHRPDRRLRRRPAGAAPGPLGDRQRGDPRQSADGSDPRPRRPLSYPARSGLPSMY